jgi:hypothetical protein
MANLKDRVKYFIMMAVVTRGRGRMEMQMAKAY